MTDTADLARHRPTRDPAGRAFLPSTRPELRGDRPVSNAPPVPPGGEWRPTPGEAAAIASVAYAVPLAMSLSTSPSPAHPKVVAWYASLRKPRFKPPDAAIPIAWTAIETALAVDAYRLLRAPPSRERTSALASWAWNVFMIGGWSRLFFGRRRLGVSTLAAATMVATGVVHQRQAAKVDATAGRAAVPFTAWVGFATVLTGTIWWLNRGR